MRLNAPAAVVGPHNRVVEPRRSGGPEELEVVDASADDSGRGISQDRERSASRRWVIGATPGAARLLVRVLASSLEWDTAL